MSNVYSLYPGMELRGVRAEFPDYEISEFHDHTGRAEFTAVLKDPYRDTGRTVLVTTGTLGDLVSELRDQGSPPLPPPCLGAEFGSVDALLTARLRDALHTMRDRGLLPHWRPDHQALN